MHDAHPLAPLVDAMQVNLTAYYRLFAGLPRVVLTEREEVGWVVGLDGPPGREVLWTRFDEAGCEERIDALLAQIGSHTDVFDWPVFRTCRPDDLGERLAARGLVTRAVPWLLADLDALPPPPTSVPDFRIEPVTTPEQLRVWWQVSARGYERDPERWRVYHDAYLQNPYGPGAACVHLLGTWRDEPVTSATLLVAGGIAGVWAVSTPPEHRRRGFGGLVTRAVMEIARQRGEHHACLMSSAMGLPLYQQLGFDALVGVPEYGWTRQRG
jgi:GNAT superfamily N-acetyltransferase